MPNAKIAVRVGRWRMSIHWGPCPSLPDAKCDGIHVRGATRRPSRSLVPRGWEIIAIKNLFVPSQKAAFDRRRSSFFSAPFSLLGDVVRSNTGTGDPGTLANCHPKLWA